MLGYKYKLQKKQKTNKEKVIKIRGGTIGRVRFVQRSLLKSEQNEQGVAGNTHTNVFLKKVSNKRQYLPVTKSFITFQKKLCQ